MYGTLPIMMPGAGHDYKEDVRRVTEEKQLPKIAEGETIEALDYLLGLNKTSSAPRTNVDRYGNRVPKQKKAELGIDIDRYLVSSEKSG